MTRQEKRLLLIFLPLAFLCVGALLYLAGPMQVAMLAALGIGFSAFLLITVSLPAPLILRGYLITCLFLVGPVQYYSTVSVVGTAANVLAIGFLFWALARWALQQGAPFPSNLRIFTGVMLLWLIQSALVTASIGQGLAGIFSIWAGYGALGGLYIAIVYGGPVAVRWVIGLLALLPFVELPFVLHQRLILLRGSASWDGVTGTFGGRAPDIGNSSTLMVFLIVATLWAIQRVQTGRMRYWMAAAIIATTLLITALGETKAFFVLLPLALAVQNWTYIIQRPIRLFLYSVFMLASMYGLMQYYEVNNYQARYANIESMSPMERLSTSFDQIMNPESMDETNGELSRGATIVLWSQTVQSDIPRALIGYGLGASRTGSLSDGAAAEMYPQYKLNSTALAQMLWDTGLIGTTAFLLFLLGSIFRLLIAASRQSDPRMAVFLRTNAAVLTVLAMTLPYKNMLMEDLTIQTLFCITLILASLPARYLFGKMGNP